MGQGQPCLLISDLYRPAPGRLEYPLSTTSSLFILEPTVLLRSCGTAGHLLSQFLSPEYLSTLVSGVTLQEAFTSYLFNYVFLSTVEPLQVSGYI